MLQLDGVECCLLLDFIKISIYGMLLLKLEANYRVVSSAPNSNATFFHADEPVPFSGFCQKIPA